MFYGPEKSTGEGDPIVPFLDTPVVDFLPNLQIFTTGDRGDRLPELKAPVGFSGPQNTFFGALRPPDTFFRPGAPFLSKNHEVDFLTYLTLSDPYF